MSLTSRLKSLLDTLIDAWPVWLWLGGLVVSILAGAYLASTAEAMFRTAGMVLQLMGLATVAVGLSQTRRLFGCPSSAAKAMSWVRRLGAVFGRSNAITGQAYVSSGEVRMSGSARVRIGATPDAPMERRVEVLEQNYALFQAEFDASVAQAANALQGLRSALGPESSARQAEANATAAKLEEMAVGGLHLESIGVIWLAIGVIGTSVPAEIANWLK